MKAFARLKNGIKCMNLPNDDNLSKGNNGLNLLVRQDLSDRAVDAQGMKTKSSGEMVRTF